MNMNRWDLNLGRPGGNWKSPALPLSHNTLKILTLAGGVGLVGVAPLRVGVGVLVLFVEGFGVFVELVPGVTGGVPCRESCCCCWA